MGKDRKTQESTWHLHLHSGATAGAIEMEVPIIDIQSAAKLRARHRAGAELVLKLV